MRPRARAVVTSVLALSIAGATAAWAMCAWDAAHGADVDGMSADRPAGVQLDAGVRPRVILVTLDGARWQDVLHQEAPLASTPAMPRLLAAAKENGVVRKAVTSSTVPISVPGYQAIYAGRTTDCASNECARADWATLLDDARAMGITGDDAAVFASWARLPLAFRADTGATVDAPPHGQGDTPWADARWDADTIELGLAHLRTHRPHFFHLALLDMDQWGHADDPRALVASLRQADAAIAAVLLEIARWPEAERRATIVVVTTDHGRGPGKLWQHHRRFAASRNTWVIAVGDRVGPGWDAPTQADLRGAIVRLLAP